MRTLLGAWGVVVVVSVLTGGCASEVGAPDLGGIYNRAAAEHDALRNPVIVIPGVLGSRLVQRDTGQTVWGAFAGGSADPSRPDGARLIALPMSDGAPLAALRDDVRPDGALDRLRVDVLGLPVQLDAYVNILGALGVGGYYDEGLGLAGAIDYGEDHYTCFQFDYDWRRDNVENARLLHDFILAKRAYVQRERERQLGVSDSDVRFDIVAHSMGGLVTRYFLRYGGAEPPEAGDASAPVPWTGAELVERAIVVGTPSAGSIDAMRTLVDGVQFAFFLPRYPAAVLGTMPALYQLLPRSRHAAVLDDEGTAIDVLDPSEWARRGWGLLDPEQDDVLRRLLPQEDDPARRREVASAHLEKCLDRARRFAAALDRPSSPPAGLELVLVAGDAVPTGAVVTATGAHLRDTASGPGDGTVLRSSALMDERLGATWQRELVTPIAWSQVIFIFADHLGLTSDAAFTDNVLYLLLEAPR